MEVHGIHGVMDIIIIGYVHTFMEVLADIIMTFLVLGVGGVMVIHFIIAIIIITTILLPFTRIVPRYQSGYGLAF